MPDQPENEPARTERLLPQPNEVRIRLYGQGLGDCFLLAFPRANEPQRPCYLVIDCGVAKSTPDKLFRTRKIVEDLHRATGGKIDALAITHQHYDHISGFLDAFPEWKKIAVGELYLPWTEATNEAGAPKGVGALREVLDRAARKALENAVADGTLDSHPGFRAEADFLGVDAADGGGGLAEMDEAMANARGLCPPEKIRYFAPGDVFRLPEANVHGYVLGPPLPDQVSPKKKRYVELLADGTEGVMYSYDPLGLEVDSGKPGGDAALALSDDHGLPALASGILAANTFDRTSDETFCPFPAAVRLDWDAAMAADFFQDHYGDAEELGADGRWRRVDTDWLEGAARLALRAGSYTNNVSLVLAFDLPGSEKMLLFPGDAQVGSWLSWHEIKEWTFRDASVPEKPPAASEKKTLMEDLLSRVAFYKVGHHASHNATIEKQGLELMTRPDLVAFVPVSVPVAQDLMGYCPMPFYPVVRALQRKTEGRVFLANGLAIEPLPKGATQEGLRAAAGIRLAEDQLPEKKNKAGKLLEEKVPLYLDLTVAREEATPS